MKTNRVYVIAACTAVAILLLTTSSVKAAAQSNDPPVITSLRPSDQRIDVTVAVEGWVKQITLESSTNLASGVWSPKAWQRASGAGTITLEVDRAERAAFFRVRAYETPSFLDRVAVGLALITNLYPDAVLYEVEATGKAATSDPTEVSRLAIVCDVTNNTALVASADGFAFDPVQFVPEPWLEDVVIPWPVSMDVMEADILLQGARYQGTFRNFTFRHPLYPGIVEPYYIFGGVAGIPLGQYVFVGVNDKKVFVGQ